MARWRGGWGWRGNAQAKGLANGPALVPASEGGVFTEVGDLHFDRSNCFDLNGQQVQASMKDHKNPLAYSWASLY